MSNTWLSRRSKRSFTFSIAMAVVLAALLLHQVMSLKRSAQARPFDPFEWRSEDSGSGARLEMLQSLLRDHLATGMPKTTVVALLGTGHPARCKPEGNALAHPLGPSRFVLLPLFEHEWLYLEFDGNDTLSRIEIHDH